MVLFRTGYCYLENCSVCGRWLKGDYEGRGNHMVYEKLYFCLSLTHQNGNAILS